MLKKPTSRYISSRRSQMSTLRASTTHSGPVINKGHRSQLPSPPEGMQATWTRTPRTLFWRVECEDAVGGVRADSRSHSIVFIREEVAAWRVVGCHSYKSDFIAFQANQKPHRPSLSFRAGSDSPSSGRCVDHAQIALTELRFPVC